RDRSIVYAIIGGVKPVLERYRVEVDVESGSRRGVSPPRGGRRAPPGGGGESLGGPPPPRREGGGGRAAAGLLKLSPTKAGPGSPPAGALARRPAGAAPPACRRTPWSGSPPGRSSARTCGSRCPRPGAAAPGRRPGRCLPPRGAAA